jgi:hypothetical protein
MYFYTPLPKYMRMFSAADCRDESKDIDSRYILPSRERGIQAAMEQVSSGDFYIEYLHRLHRIIGSPPEAGREHRNTGTRLGGGRTSSS